MAYRFGIKAFFSLLLAGIMVVGCGGPTTPPATNQETVIGLAVNDMCDRRIVLLGETGDHGGGKALALKAAIVQELVEKCGFDTLLFEAGFYDFAKLHLEQRENRPVSIQHISSAIGGLWNNTAELAPLLPVLADKMNEGELLVAGIDDNLGSAGAFYSLSQMPTDLSGLLAEELRDDCYDELKQLIYGSYGPGGPDKSRIDPVMACLDAISEAVSGSVDLSPVEKFIAPQIIRNMRSFSQRLISDQDEQRQLRENAFLDNYWWWAARRSANSKTIIWGASVHFAKSSKDAAGYGDSNTAGANLHQEYGAEAFALSFSARSGTYRKFGRADPAEIPTPDASSFEAMFADGAGFSYAGPKFLAELGHIPAAIFQRQAVPVNLSDASDAVIVIHEERSPSALPSP